jgi:hypothetical protein
MHVVQLITNSRTSLADPLKVTWWGSDHATQIDEAIGSGLTGLKTKAYLTADWVCC